MKRDVSAVGCMVCGYIAPLLPGELKSIQTYRALCPVCQNEMILVGRDTGCLMIDSYKECKKNHDLVTLLDEPEISIEECSLCGVRYTMTDMGMWTEDIVDAKTLERIPLKAKR